MSSASPNIPKLHLNENMSPRLAAVLRKHEFDVTSSQEEGLLKASDEEQLAFAVSQQRAIVTFSIPDFVALHNAYVDENKEHWGIVFSDQQPIGVLLRRRLRLLNALTVEDLRNQIRWLNEFK